MRARIWTDTTSDGLRAEYRVSLTAMMAVAQALGTVRRDAAVTDLDLLFWSLREIIEATGGVSATAWRRHVAITVAGLQPAPEPLAEPPITHDLVTRARAAAIRR